MTPTFSESAPDLTADDVQQLKLLSWGHFILGGLTVLCGFFPFIHLAVGIGMVSGEMGGRPEPAGWIFVAVASALIAFFWATAGLTIYAGRCLREQRKRTLCFAVAILQCVFFQPIGLVLGVFSIIVLIRPSVKAAFERAEGAPVAF
ncbi:MAG: hypothetical protein H6719_10985 [Sandaracinaceae bacterium]|nr:hypothetical protein [Sandaracinaceae bacterium]